MALVRWSPLSSIWDDASLVSNPISLDTTNLDVFETEDEVVVKANVAGVEPNEVDVTFEKGVLWIRAERTETDNDTERKYYSRSSRSYSYKVAVPGMIDHGQEPTAEVEDGIVTISFKKAEASKPKKLAVKRKK